MRADKDVAIFIGHSHSGLTYLLFSRAGTSPTSCVDRETDENKRADRQQSQSYTLCVSGFIRRRRCGGLIFPLFSSKVTDGNR